METGKLYNLLIDINNSAINSEIQSKIDLFASSILNKTPDITKYEEELNKLLTVKNFEFIPSDSEILDKIGGKQYFGISAKEEIQSILKKNSYNIQKIYDDLQLYKNEREFFLGKISDAIDAFEFFDIDIYYPLDNFQIGLLLPSSYTQDNSVKNVTKELNRWDKIIKNIKEVIGEEVEDTKIEFVSNGSIDFFFENSERVAHFLSASLHGIVLIYDKIKNIRQKRKELKELGISTTEEKNIEKQEKDILNKDIDKLSNDLIKEFASKKIEPGRANELKIAINGHVKYLAKYIDNGVVIEINVPQNLEPEKIKEDDSDNKRLEKEKKIKEYQQLKEKIDLIKKSMETVNTVQKVGMDLIKLLGYNDEDYEDDKES